jgi:hypothetical protein
VRAPHSALIAGRDQVQTDHRLGVRECVLPIEIDAVNVRVALESDYPVNRTLPEVLKLDVPLGVDAEGIRLLVELSTVYDVVYKRRVLNGDDLALAFPFRSVENAVCMITSGPRTRSGGRA